MTLFPVSTELAGPKHSTSVPSSSEVAVPLSVDEKEVAFVPNPVPGVAIKSLLGPQVAVEVDICGRVHRLLLSFTLQIVTPFITPLTLHVKEKVSPGQVGGGVVNCPDTSPVDAHIYFTWYLWSVYVSNSYLNGIADQQATLLKMQEMCRPYKRDPYKCDALL